MGILKDGPTITVSKATYTLLMRAFIAVLLLAVVALVALEPVLAP
jgi:hypothetical protein